MPTNPDPWPRQMQITGGTLTVYQPQVDSWDGGFLKFRAAVAVKPSDGGQEVFGVIRASAHTLVDRTARMVSLFNFSLLQIDFPSLPDHGQRYYADLGRLLPGATTRISLDRLQGFLTVQKLTAKNGGGEERSAGDHRQLSDRRSRAGLRISGAPHRRRHRLSTGRQHPGPDPLWARRRHLSACL